MQTSAWIRTISEDEAQGDLKVEYEEVKRARGRVSNVLKSHSLDPKSIRHHLDLYLHLMFGKSSLSRAEREMIATAVSQQNSCRYCLTHHGEALLAHVHDPSLVESIKKDYSHSEISPRDKAMLAYATKLTKTPGELSQMDIENLREAGFTDEEILRINLITSYFNFANRIVSGLGVQLETKKDRVYKH